MVTRRFNLLSCSYLLLLAVANHVVNSETYANDIRRGITGTTSNPHQGELKPSAALTVKLSRNSQGQSDSTIQKSNNHFIENDTSSSNNKQTSTNAIAIQSFLNDIQYLQSQPKTNLTTPCIDLCRDTTYTRLWSLKDWQQHSKHALSRYCAHFLSWPASTTMHNILGAVAVTSLWSLFVSMVAKYCGPVEQIMMKFAITLTFLQAPILLLLTLRTNRALDRVLEARRAWGGLNRASRSFMGLVCAYIIPNHPNTGCIIARYLCMSGWALKGTLRDEDDSAFIQNIMHSVPQESHWMLHQSDQTGLKHPHIIIYRLRNILASLKQDDVPSMILLRMEEILYDIEAAIGICNRILTSPIPPTYTRHTSRILVLYLSILPIALVGMGIGRLGTTVTVACASYIIIGVDEIGLEIENPFPLMPLFGLSKGIQNEVER